MSASMKIDLSDLINLSQKVKSPYLVQQLNNIPQQKGVVALVAQAIADNFTKEGPGWKPLSPKTIRSSVSQKMRKKLSELTDKQLVALEAQKRRARAGGSTDKGDVAYRKILRRTSVLLKSVTTPGGPHNIYKVEGTNLVWGTDLIYAGVHNYGYKNIPKREFLKIREEWELKLWQYVLDRTVKIIMADAFMKGNG
jgi:phage gpG-like protein